MFTAQDYRFMGRAIELAHRGQYTTTPNPNVGCVLVNDGSIVGEGFHQCCGEPHAEVLAIREAQEKSHAAIAYVTLEPCSHFGRTPPCCEALKKAGVTKVIAAMQDPNPHVSGKGLQQLQAAGIDTSVGLLQSEAEQLNRGFISRMVRHRPYVRLKMAASLDGRTAMASGESQWITGDPARADVHRLRALSSAIITGVDTVLADNPSLTVRHRPDHYSREIRQPTRVICDSQLRIPLDAKLLKQPGQTIILTCHNNAKVSKLENTGAKIRVFEAKNGRLPLTEVMQQLAQLEMNDVMLETGATLAGAFVQENLVDELWLYLAPHLMGDNARGLFHLPGLFAMQDRKTLLPQDIRQIGNDIRIRMTFSAKI